MHEGSLKFGFSAAVLIAWAMIAGCTGDRDPGVRYRIATGGVAQRGHSVILDKHCGSCHTIPGVSDAKGVVGPPLMFFGRRTFIAGQLPNNPDNLVRWIRNPQSVEPDTAMPDLGLTDQQARDVVAYLYQLR
ncbi:MAG TPA: c-type cytochrome [Bryobacteraceae bacterium]|nr:c-type cytochrome [Bryobacteraceae bacterium]